jgi:hypothetical protein
MLLPWKEAGALQNSQSPVDTVMGAVMQLPWDQHRLRRCSILLMFEKLTIWSRLNGARAAREVRLRPITPISTPMFNFAHFPGFKSRVF